MADSDPVLWQRTVAGDRDAFAELYRRHSRRIYNYCFRRLGNWSEAEDLTAAVFLEAYRRRTEAAVDPDKFVAWLFGVATNLANNRGRTLGRRQRLLARIAAAAPVSATPDAASRLEAEERMRAILERLTTLPRGQQDVVALCLWSGLSYDEAAAALSIPVGTVRSRLARARAALVEQDGDSRHELREAQEVTQ